MIVKIALPNLGEGIEKAIIVEWLVKPGDQIGVDDDLVEISTDKAIFNVPSTVKGCIKEILCDSGKEVRIGDHLAVVDSF